MQEKQPNPETIFAQARAAQPQIAAMSLQERVRFLKNLRLTILDDQEQILDVLQKDVGKSRLDAVVAEIFSVLDFIEYLEHSGPKILGPEKVSTPLVLFPKKSRIYYEPLGIVLAIVPWNYPFYTGLIPCLSSFLAGNATILKPSEFTPLKNLMESLFEKAGMHPHWIQVAYGDGKLGAGLIDCQPNKIFFTGGTETGKKIMRQAADYLIPVGLELGGKDPMVVFGDANLERATSGALWGGFCNAGQTCTSVERCYVQADVFNEFVKKLAVKASQLKVGADQDGSMDMGRITTPEQKTKIWNQIEDAVQKGARVILGKKEAPTTPYMTPTILTDIPENAAVLQEETFGPIIAVIPFKTEEEAIRLANDSEYGLSASVWGGDAKQVERVVRQIQTGNISVNNVMISQANPHLPFGGVKQSGFGRTKGSLGLRAFTAPKSVLFDKNTDKIEAHWYPYTPQKYRMFQQLIRHLFGGGGIFRWFKVISTAIKLENYANKVGKNAKR